MGGGYDICFAIGGTCESVNLLKYHNLRKFSNPFDWTTPIINRDEYDRMCFSWDTAFINKINSLTNRFCDYFDFHDFIQQGEVDHNFTHTYCCAINTKTKIRFPHLFSCNKSFEDAFLDAKQLIDRRAQRLLNAIDKFDRILIVHATNIFSHILMIGDNVKDASIVSAVNKCAKSFPGKHIDFVFFENDGTKKRGEIELIQICPTAYRIRSNHFEHDNETRNHYCGAHAPILSVATVMSGIKLRHNDDKMINIIDDGVIC